MNSIEVIKRNSANIPLYLYSNGQPIQLGGGDFLVFTVRKKIEDEEYLFRKVITNENYMAEQGCYTVDILPEDTESVELNNYDDRKFLRYDVTFYNSKNSNVEITVRRGDFIVSWRASKEGDS